MTAINLTLGWVADAVGAPPQRDGADRAVGDVVTDSRTLQAGDLFVALRGPRFDGHAFVADALAGGAAGAIVERGRVQEDARGRLQCPTRSRRCNAWHMRYAPPSRRR